MTKDRDAVVRPGASRLRWCGAAVLATSAIVFVLFRAPLLSVPFERDEGEYAYIAQRLLAGEVPYRDAFDQKPPGVFLVYAGAFLLLGPSVESIHLVMYAWTAATALALFGCVRRLSGPLAGCFAVLVLAMATADPRLTANAANTEIFMLLPMVASLYCMIRALEPPSRLHWWVLCGALGAAACWFKQVAITHALYVALVPAILALRSRARAGLPRAFGGLLAGAALVTAPGLLALAAAGAWDPFVDAVFLHNLQYSQTNRIAVVGELLAHRLGEQAGSLGVFWLLAILALGIPAVMGRRSRALLGGWLVASAAGVCVGFFFRPHYFIQLLPALAALSGTFLAWTAARLLARPSAMVAGLGTVALLAIAVVPPFAANAAIRGAGTPIAISREIYGMNPFPESLEIGKYIRRTSGPDDRVYVIGSEPQILFYADRRSATRYIFFYPLTGSYPGALARQRSVVAEVAAARPLYVVWSNFDASMLVEEDTETFLFDAAMRMLERAYRLEFVAFPQPGEENFEFVYGIEARNLMRRNRERAGDAAWIALYRRR